jgi:hypothetical protein
MQYTSLSRPQGHRAAGRFVSMKNSTVGNRTREIPACNQVPVTAVPSRAPHMTRTETILVGYKGDGFLGRDAMVFGIYVPSFGTIRRLPARYIKSV